MQPDEPDVEELDADEDGPGEFFQVRDDQGRPVALSRKDTRIRHAHPHAHKPLVRVTFDDGLTVTLNIRFARLIRALRKGKHARKREEREPDVSVPGLDDATDEGPVPDSVPTRREVNPALASALADHVLTTILPPRAEPTHPPESVAVPGEADELQDEDTPHPTEDGDVATTEQGERFEPAPDLERQTS